MKNAIVSLVVVSLAGPALAQTNATFVLTSSNTVSPTISTTTIEIWAMWDDPGSQFFFGGAGFDLTAGDGEFSNPVNIINGPGSTTGVITGNIISGALLGQFCGSQCSFPFIDPILLATYDWTTTNFEPRAVDLFTSNTQNFIVTSIQTGSQVNLFPREFTPGAGIINVVPAPAAWLVLALPLVAGRRRRT